MVVGHVSVSSGNDGFLCLWRRSPENSYTSGCLLMSKMHSWLFRPRSIESWTAFRWQFLSV